MAEKPGFISEKSLCGLESADIRTVLKGMGYSHDDLATKRPMIGIANSFSTLIPGHFNFTQLSEQVKKGIHRAGGTAFEFGTIGLCDAVAKEMFNYVLPSREVICDSVEIMAKSNPLDGLVLMASCDKIVPGMLMAAARVDLPAIVINGGPMLGGVQFSGRKGGFHFRLGSHGHVKEEEDRRGDLSHGGRSCLSYLRPPVPLWVPQIPCAVWPRRWE